MCMILFVQLRVRLVWYSVLLKRDRAPKYFENISDSAAFAERPQLYKPIKKAWGKSPRLPEVLPPCFTRQLLQRMLQYLLCLTNVLLTNFVL